MAKCDTTLGVEVDQEIKRRAYAVLKANGMTMSGAIKRMVRLGILEHRIPFEVTRDPVFADVGISDAVASAYGIEKGAFRMSGIADAVVVRMDMGFKNEMRRYCREMCTNPNNLVHMFLGQIAFELRLPFVD